MNYTPGVYDIEIEDYHSSDGISRSGIMLFKKSPLHYWDKYKNPNRNKERKSTPQQLLGEIVHSIILEPKEFNHRYFVEEKIDRRTKLGKERWEEILAENIGKQFLSQDMFDQAQKMFDSFSSNKDAVALLDKAQIEKSIYWKDCKTNVLCKARPDIWHSNMVCDLKTIQDASPKSFQRSMAAYGYHIQAAMIQDGIHHAHHSRITDYVFIAIETVEPYAVAIYILDQESIKQGHEEYQSILKDFNDYEEKNLSIWPSYKPSIISLPAYY